MLLLLFGTHIALTIRLGFIQRYLFSAIRISLIRRREGEGDISQFGSLATALSATIGTGNIVGVATAIASGGPGALFWMWISGFFGIATKYAEALLSFKYRVRIGDHYAGGPMYVLSRGLNMPRLAALFSLMTVIASFGIGNMVQSNSISVLLEDSYQVPGFVTGVMLAILTVAVIFGGIRSIARVSERLVPLMGILYVSGCLILLFLHYETIPDTISLIFSSAFNGEAAAGGFAGATIREAIRYGISRGLFSNESGMGSAPIVAAAAQSENPVRQALVSSTGTFWDTVVICAFTGVTIVNSGLWSEGAVGAALTSRVFDQIPTIGSTVLSLSLLTFVFSTILGWSYYGEKALEFLYGGRYTLHYRIAWVIAVFLGAITSMPSVWAFADIANAMMALPNLLSLLLLNGVIVAESRAHLRKGELHT
jgi:AGCS family alanine or glycine:cation symporter